MQHIRRSLVLILLLVAIFQLTACGGGEEKAEKAEPALVEEIEGSEFNRVTLTEKAAERLGIETAPMSSSPEMVIPYSAVLYGLHGETWTYTNPEPLTFIRHPITVDYIEGGQAFLLDGPPDGTEVVVVGAQMLYGTDTGVGK
jgi:hypothetical protein